MAKVSYIDLTPEEYDLFYKSIKAGDRYINSRVNISRILLSKARKLSVSGRSLFSVLAEAWWGLSQEDRDDWDTAAGLCGTIGWRLFVKDTCARWKAGLEGLATPNLYHQAKVGQLHIGAPATELKIAQYHPSYYYISQKVPGKKGMYQPVMVSEHLALPLELRINYKSELTAQGAGAFAKFYARVHHLYQGTDLYTELSLNFDLEHGWTTVSDSLSGVTGLAVHYDLFIHLYNVRGDLYIDNVEANHSGQNWCRDWICKDINEGFTRAFYQVMKHWEAVIISEGADFESVYKDFE